MRQARASKSPADAPPRVVDEADELGAQADDAAPALVRLNKYLAGHGIASRRKCDELIATGKVSVDGQPATELGLKIDPELQTVEIDGFVLSPRGQMRRYYLLNKPAGVVCTNEARETRPRAVDLVTDRRKGRIYTVGRLDEESKGLIVLTNDGDFANRIMHPRYGVEKTYVVKLAGKIDEEALQRVREGVHLSEGKTGGARVLVLKRERESSTLALTLREGMNREIRRAFARVGFKVVDLRRTRIGPVNDRGLKIGRWRELRADEVALLLAGRNATEPERGRPVRGDRRPRQPGSARRGATRGVTRAGALRAPPQRAIQLTGALRPAPQRAIPRDRVPRPASKRSDGTRGKAPEAAAKRALSARGAARRGPDRRHGLREPGPQSMYTKHQRSDHDAAGRGRGQKEGRRGGRAR